MELSELAPVPGYAGRYATRDGRIFSLRELKPTYNGRYWKVAAPGQRQGSVHRMVLLAYEGEPDGGLLACHRDGDRDNNSLDNLYWGTSKENAQDRVRHGSPNRPLVEDDIRAIRTRYDAGESINSIARSVGVTHGPVARICRRESWRHID